MQGAVIIRAMNPKNLLKSFLICFFLALASIPALSAPKVEITFYHSPHCKHCLRIKKEVIPVIENKYENRLVFVWRNTAEPDALKEFLDLCSRYHADAFVPAMFVKIPPDETYLYVGSDNIENNIFVLLDTATKEPLPVSGQVQPSDISSTPAISTEDRLVAVFRRFSHWSVIGAGLIDGINPCAFAVIILFISFLSAYGYSRSQMAVVGLFYIVAVFLAYLLIGMGFFNVLYSLNFFYVVIKAFYIGVIGLCFILGILSLYDYITIRKTGQTEGVSLQLPPAIKKRIQLIFAHEYRQKTPMHIWRLAGGAFSVGIMVSVLEAVCTGQVYVPVLAMILKIPTLKIRAFWYLVLYNLMFILPLIIIFLLALLGVGSSRMGTFLRTHTGIIKILLAILFFSLGFFILFTEFF